MSLKVLLIEDNPVNLDVQSRMLSRLGAQVTSASNGLDGLDVFRAGEFDLVFIDWQMPVMDGIETAKKIREEVTSRPPFLVVLSGHALPGDKDQLLACGFDEYLSKPVRLADFQQVIHQFFPPKLE